MFEKVKKKLKIVIRRIKSKEYIPIYTPIDPNYLFKDKVALITGGSSGIGLEIAREYLRRDAKVIIAGTKKEKLDNIIAEAKNPNLKAIVIDVTNIKALQKKIDEAAKMFGSIDILVNSAGVVSKHDFFNVDEEEYDSIMDTNTKGTFFVSKYVGEYMVKNKVKGHILNVTSSSALRPAWTPYQMSKWAVRGFTLGLADTLIKHGIVVNAIAPGPTATPMLGIKEDDTLFLENSPAKRYITPTEIANLAMFMTSDMGNMIVGDTFYMTGGSGTITYHN